MSTNATKPARLDFIDVQRGLAVLLMLWMHTADGWLRPALKQGTAWNTIRAVGGLAAPLFLLLAGLSLGLSWTASDRVYTAAQRRLELARGLQLIALGYGLRLYMWMLDGGGALRFHAWLAALPFALGLFAWHRGLADWARGLPARRLAGLALVATIVGGLSVSYLIPNRLWRITRVDILQAIGASLVLLVLGRRAVLRWPLAALLAALTVAALTPWMRGLLPGPLPDAIAGYIAAWDTPQTAAPPTLFPLFPWFSYVLIGGAIGAHLGQQQRRGGSAERTTLALACIGVLLALGACEPLPPAHALIYGWPSLTQPVRLVYRVGTALALGGCAVALSHARAPLPQPLRTLGRTSLFVYWVHLEFAFGVIAKPIAHRLSVVQWAVGWVVLSVAMTALAGAWLRARGRFSPHAAQHARSDETGAKAATFGSA